MSSFSNLRAFILYNKCTILYGILQFPVVTTTIQNLWFILIGYLCYVQTTEPALCHSQHESWLEEDVLCCKLTPSVFARHLVICLKSECRSLWFWLVYLPWIMQLESGARCRVTDEHKRKVTKQRRKATASKVPGLWCKYNRTIIKGASPLPSLK